MGGRTAIIGGGVLAALAGARLSAADADPFPLFDPAKRPVVAPRQPQPPADPPPVADPFREPPLRRPDTPKDNVPARPGTPGATTANQAPADLPAGPGNVAPGDGGPQRIRFGPRYGTGLKTQLVPDQTDPSGERSVFLLTGGVVVNVETRGQAQASQVELQADRAVAWVRRPKKGGGGLADPIDAEAGKTEVELYLSGNVVIRTSTLDDRNRPVPEVIHAAEAYYDSTRSRGVFRDATVDLNLPDLPEPVRLAGAEMDQLGKNHFEVYQSKLSASKRPSNPGLNFTADRSVFTREFTTRTNVFGIPYRNLSTGEPDVGYEQILTSYRVKPRVFDVPFFYLPRARADIREPFGPLTGFATGNDRILGFQLYTTFDLFKLAGLRGPAGHRWLLFGDYFGERGAAGGTEYDYTGADLFGLADRDATGAKPLGGFNQPFVGMARGYVVNDTKKNRLSPFEDPRLAVDILGGDRGLEPIPPGYRSRLQFRHNQDIYEDGTTYLRALAQVQYFSDKNFYEQYYKNQFDLLPNQETFAYLYGASGHVGGAALVQSNLKRRWITETEWLPRADGFVVGQSFLDLFTYSSRASAGYAELKPATTQPFPVVPTDVDVKLGRFVWNQRLEAPLDAGPVRITPYGVMDLGYWSSDLGHYYDFDPARTDPVGVPTDRRNIPNRFAAGQNLGYVGTGFPVNPPPPTGPSDGRARFYGGGGLAVSTNFSRLYPDAASELFNVNGLYHKVTPKANYFAAYSDTPYYRLPQLDRVNDDATDQAFRTTRPRQQALIQDTGRVLGESPLFDPQQYAIRRLVENKAETLDSIEVLQLGLDQRLQTKRGFPGAQHTVDWVTLNLSASVFPDEDRDNYGQTAAFYEYYFLWHLGDRVSVTSAGWYDPIENGPRYFNAGVNFSRPDGTNVFLSYRHTDPLRSRAVTAGINYNLNKKYSVNLNSTYDFGLNSALNNQISLARAGADVTVLFGVSYNSLQNNFGLQFAVVPNLLGAGAGGLNQAPFYGQR